MAVSLEALLEELKVFEVEVEEAAAEKLMELCVAYRYEEQDFATEWIAFSATKSLPLTLDNLEIFEHDVLSKKANKAHQAATKRDSRVPGSLVAETLQDLMEAEEEDEALLDYYTTPAKGSQKRALRTPDNPRSKRGLSLNRSPQLIFSPASFSPSVTPSQKYNSRMNRGEVVVRFGTVQGTSWRGAGGRSASAKLFIADENYSFITKGYKFMFQKLADIREVLFCRIEALGNVHKDHYSIEEFASVSLPAQELVTVLGQIGCDSNGKLNPRSIILEGDREYSSGFQVPVDLSDLREYSFFPGQVVVMEGINSTGGKLVVSKIYEGVLPPFYKPEEDDESEQQMVLVACGPYTTSDSINYDPLKDLIEVINRDQPDVCILLGPFLDVKHEQVENCQLTGTFEEVFKKCLKAIIEGTRSSGSLLVFVPSLRDVHHEFVYPQPPFDCYKLTKEDAERVHFVSDPSTVNINGVLFGLTSTDILFHMGAEEISRSVGGSDRFSRILRHILTQRSFYPLYPPAEEVNVDYECFQACAQIPVTPDVLIVPSELRYFLKDVGGCVCMNPGRLTKGQVGGTFGRLLVKRQPAAAERQTPCIAAQIVKI
ncbi:DNA polymerase alpha subunit B [Latimeria chalumnae]|uniref:DNA polymerase alpha subunit B n=1 Tax=Latimeria chalumnae TaxID=7897 RepID=UPI00313DC137